MNAEAAKTTDSTATQQRIITIVATRGAKVRINFPGNKFADLKNILQRGGTDVDGKSFQGYDLNNLKCVEGLNKTTLEHAEAVIPDGDLNIFLMPYKSKSGGNMSRSDINATIKEFIANDGEKAKAHFGNYTRVSSAELTVLIESYLPGTAKGFSEEKAKAISDIVSSVSESKKEEIVHVLDGLTVDQKLDVVITLLLSLKSNTGTTPSASTATATVAQPTAEEIAAQQEADRKAQEEKERKEKEDAERKRREEEDSKLDAELNSLMGGFDDVRRR